MSENISELEDELKKKSELLNNKVNNLIYLLINVDIKDINLINFHFDIIKLLNEIDYLEKLIFNNKY